MRALLLALPVMIALLAPQDAGAMAVDVSDDTIRVTTGFNGTSLTVFGMQEQPGSVVIVVEGPPKNVTVRRKSRVLGLWTNTDSREFRGVPYFYEVAAADALEKIATPDVLTQNRIGVDHLTLAATESGDADFSAALIETQAAKRLFVRAPAALTYPGPMLFKARFDLPAIVAPGQYKVSAYLFRDGGIIDQDSTPFVVVPEGLSADMRRFATQNGLLYGLAGMLMAVFAGWLATVLLKRE